MIYRIQVMGEVFQRSSLFKVNLSIPPKRERIAASRGRPFPFSMQTVNSVPLSILFSLINRSAKPKNKKENRSEEEKADSVSYAVSEGL